MSSMQTLQIDFHELAVFRAHISRWEKLGLHRRGMTRTCLGSMPAALGFPLCPAKFIRYVFFADHSLTPDQLITLTGVLSGKAYGKDIQKNRQIYKESEELRLTERDTFQPFISQRYAGQLGLNLVPTRRIKRLLKCGVFDANTVHKNYIGLALENMLRPGFDTAWALLSEQSEAGLIKDMLSYSAVQTALEECFTLTNKQPIEQPKVENSLKSDVELA